MNSNLAEINSLLEIELQLLTAAYFWGDYSILLELINVDSKIFRAFKSKQLEEVKAQIEGKQINLNPQTLDEKELQEYRKIFGSIKEKYADELRDDPVPPPSSFIKEFADNALDLGNFLAASSALEYTGSLNARVNQHITQGTQFLNQKEILALPEDTEEKMEEEVLNNIEMAAKEFYTAVKLKNSMGPQFQYKSWNLHFKNRNLWNKYERYVSMNNLKEVINFCIHYLTDNEDISKQIVANRLKGKTRKVLLKKLSELFSNGQENFKTFISRYDTAVESLKSATTHSDFSDIQKILLGRGTGTEDALNYIRELSVSHPISSLICCLKKSPKDIDVVCPYMVGNRSLMEILELS